MTAEEAEPMTERKTAEQRAREIVRGKMLRDSPELVTTIAAAIAAAKREAIEHLRLAATRLEILTGRMRACNEETGKHELLDEAEMFCQEARAACRALVKEAE